MSDLSIFNNGSKVVVSPDKMRAWISLMPPKGGQYTAAAVQEWLVQNGVTYGADEALIQNAITSRKYDDLLEVARGKMPVAPAGGDYVLKIEKKPFTGLKSSNDGSLIYDDLSFLQEAQAGQVLAEITPPVPAANGVTVNGEEIPPRGGTPGRELAGSGFAVSEDGKLYTAPTLSHVSIVNDQLVVIPLKKVDAISEETGEVTFEGNLLVKGDVTANAAINVTGSVYVEGRAVSCTIKAGNNVLLSQGMRSEGGGFGKVEAKGHVWGQFFESAEIAAGGDLFANHLTGCEVSIQGRANILGGRALIAGTNIYAQNGVVAGTLGEGMGSTNVSAGMSRSLLDNYNAVVQKADRLGQDVQALQQNITAHERVNRMKPDKGKNDPAYKEMLAKRDQSLSVLNILNNERTRQKRIIDQFSSISIIAREVANPGVVISIDTRTRTVDFPMKKTKFRRDKEAIEAVSSQQRD